MRARGNGNACSSASPDAGSRHAVVVADGSGWSRLVEALEFDSKKLGWIPWLPNCRHSVEGQGCHLEAYDLLGCSRAEGAPSLASDSSQTTCGSSRRSAVSCGRTGCSGSMVGITGDGWHSWRWLGPGAMAMHAAVPALRLARGMLLLSQMAMAGAGWSKL